MLQPHLPTMQAPQQVREAEWHSLATRTRAQTPFAGAFQAVPLWAVHHGSTHRDLLRVQDSHRPTNVVMRRRRQKFTRKLIAVQCSIFCGGLEEETCHMQILCARGEAAARILCA